MDNRLEAARSALLEAESSRVSLEKSYRAFLRNIAGVNYFGLSGNIARRNHEQQISEFRVSWSKSDHELRELAWQISDLEKPVS